MKKQFRLKSTQDFQRVRKYGKAYTHPLLVLIFLANDSDQIRIGVAAGKSLGNAVSRNRAKRVMRTAGAPLVPRINPGADLVLIARKPILKAKSDQVQEALSALLDEAGLLN